MQASVNPGRQGILFYVTWICSKAHRSALHCNFLLFLD
jgi:hypothetical protein